MAEITKEQADALKKKPEKCLSLNEVVLLLSLRVTDLERQIKQIMKK